MNLTPPTGKPLLPKSGSVIMDVALVDLVIEPDAQREVDDKRAQKMADNWDPHLVGVITVAVDPVTGIRYVVDGGHRFTAAVKAGLSTLRAELIYGLTQAQRADLFLKLQAERKNPNPLSRFRISITAGRQRETEIAACLAGRGMHVGGSPSSNVIATISGLNQTWDEGGMALVGTTIDVLKAAFASFGGDAWQPDILRGTAMVLYNNAHIDHKRLVHTLQRRDPRTWQSWIASASGGPGGSGGRPYQMKKLIIDRYNSGLQKTSKNRIK